MQQTVSNKHMCKTQNFGLSSDNLNEEKKNVHNLAKLYHISFKFIYRAANQAIV